MKRLIGILGGLALAILATPAQAQKYYESDGGLYWSVRGGMSQVRNGVAWVHGGYDPIYDAADNLLAPGLNDHLEWRSLEMNYGYVVGTAIGYTMLYPNQVGDLRFELEGIYRRNDDGQINSPWEALTDRPDSITLGFETVPIIGFVDVKSAMFNVLADIHTQTRFTPYLGMGAGISELTAEGETQDFNRGVHGFGFPQFFDETIYALSWQAIAGVGYQLTPGTMVTLEFRHFKLNTDRWSGLFQTDELRNVTFDDWSMGLRFTF